MAPEKNRPGGLGDGTARSADPARRTLAGAVGGDGVVNQGRLDVILSTQDLALVCRLGLRRSSTMHPSDDSFYARLFTLSDAELFNYLQHYSDYKADAVYIAIAEL